MENLKAMKDIGTKSLEIGTDLENYIKKKKGHLWQNKPVERRH